MLESVKKNGLKLRVGQTAKMILNENPSTGYGWEFNKELPGDLYKVERKYVHGNYRPGVVGGGGSCEITVTALKPGSAKLHAASMRPWEFQGWDDEDNLAGLNSLKLDLDIESDKPILGSERLETLTGVPDLMIQPNGNLQKPQVN